jgi:hypothetical protein
MSLGGISKVPPKIPLFRRYVMVPIKTAWDNKKPAIPMDMRVSETLWDGMTLSNGARDRNRTGTPAIHEAADFKSAVSTYFTTRAEELA